MDDKKLIDNLAKITEQLKTISKSIGISVGVSSKGGEVKVKPTLSNEEKARIKSTATETAKIYKNVLGLGYSKQETDAKADRFRVILGITPFFNKLQTTFTNIKDFLKNVASDKTKPSDIYLADLEALFSSKKPFENLLLQKIDNLNKTSVDSLNELKNNPTSLASSDILDQLVIANQNFVTMDQNNLTRSNSLMIGVSDIHKVLTQTRDFIANNLTKLKISSSEYVRSVLAFKKILDWDNLKNGILNYLSDNKIRTDKTNKNLEDLILINDEIKRQAIENNKKKTKNDTGKSILEVGGLMSLGIGLFLIVNALLASGSIGVVQTLKVLGIVYAFVKLFMMMNKVENDIKEAAKGFAILAGTMLLLVIPLFTKLQTIPIGMLLNGLFKMSLVVSSCIGLMVLMKFIKPSDVKESSKGLAMLMLVIGFIAIPLFQYVSSINFDQLLEGIFKFGILFAACWGMVLMMSKIKGNDVTKSSLGLGVLSLVMGFVVIPLFMKIAQLPFTQILKGLAYMTLSIGILGGIAFLLSKFVKEVLVGSLVLLGMAGVLYVLSEVLGKFADKNWDSIYEGLKIAGLAIGGFAVIVGIIGALVANPVGALVASVGLITVLAMAGVMYALGKAMGTFADRDWDSIMQGLKIAALAIGGFSVIIGMVGALVANPVGALVAAAGLATILAMSYAMGYLAENLVKYNTINADNLYNVGSSLSVLSQGLISLLGGSVTGVGAGIVNGLSSFFGLDPVAQIKKFLTLDEDKILKLGIGLKFMGEGLKVLSSNDMSLQNVTKELTQMAKPLSDFSSSLNSFADAYQKLDKVKLESEYNMNLVKDDSIQNAIKSLNEQELEVQKAQLDQLIKNGEYLRLIASNGGGGVNQSFPNINSIESGGLSGPNFETKNKYMNNLKLTTMSFQA